MKLFIPAVGYRIKLTSDWTFDVFYEYRNSSMLKKLGVATDPSGYPEGSPYVDDDIRKGYKSIKGTLPKGTLLEIDRVYVRTINKSAVSVKDDYDSITFKVLGEKSKVRFWVKLSDANNIEFELPEDFTAGKDEAREKAKKPKKLKLQDISDLVYGAINGYGYAKAAKWCTDEFKRSLSELASEFERRQRPLDEAEAAKREAEYEAYERRRFNSGDISIPIGLANSIKTYEDYKRHFPHSNSRRVNENLYKHDYFVRYTLLNAGYESKSTFSRDENNRCVRRFRRKSPSELAKLGCYNTEKNADVSDMWIDVVTNEEDTEIVEVNCGIDK